MTPEQIANIPQELKLLPQWVGASENKIPVCPATGGAASVIDPSTWGTFDDALLGERAGKYPNLGFVFTDSDPYLFIDLDAPKDPHSGEVAEKESQAFKDHVTRALSWIKAFDSYTEMSKSGSGYHIIVKGHIDAAIKTRGVEMYFSKRYCIFTGQALVKAPVSDRHDMVAQAVQGLRLTQRKVTQTSVPAKQPPETEGDSVVLERMFAASNGDAVKTLWSGGWSQAYPSQSEADHALLAHLCFYCRNDTQVIRLFRQSALGKRAKANNPRDPYLETSIAKIRAEQPKPVDFSSFSPPPPRKPHAPLRPYPHPPGTLGELADYMYGAAIHPVKEVAYAGAISWAAGVMGRHYNISGTGINQYVLLLAGTGKGKEGASDGIDLVYQALRPNIPEVEMFRGPSNLASGAGLIRTLSDREVPAALAVVGEFGLRLSAMTDPRANAAEITLKAALLDLFSKSGQHRTLAPVAYSDTAKNTKLLEAPAFSMLGVSTPETFFSGLTEASVVNGLIPRFLSIMYDGPAQVSSTNRVTQMDEPLRLKLLKAAETSIYMSRNSSFCHIPMTAAASKGMREFEEEVVKRMNALDGESALLALLNRCHLKALRLAALAAALDDPASPKVTDEHSRWAVDFVEADMGCISSRFENGGVGEGDARQMNVLREKLRSFFSPSKPPSKDLKWLKMLQKGAIPHSLISQKLLSVSCFANDRRGATAALNACLKEMTVMGEIREIPKEQVSQEFGTSSRAYFLIDG